MRGLLFGVEPEGDGSDLPDHANDLERALATTPMGLRDLEDPGLLGPDWVVLRSRLCGICGSDAKQVFMDAEPDNAMSAVISFPQVLGHELVATVERVGPRAVIEPGTRVVLNPWLSCAPRGIDPACDHCQRGEYSLCENFTIGRLPPGIHSGNSSAATGGFAEFVPAHDSMCIPVPDDVPDEIAVLADPFSVSLHAIVNDPPPPHGTVLVYGIGALGSMAVAGLRALHPDLTIIAVARFEHQAALADRLGADVVVAHEPREDIVARVAEVTGATVQTPFLGMSWLYPGGVDVVYDTIAAPETLEVGVRVARTRGTVSITGVAAPGRFEWTPWYFKELSLVGRNAFGVEEVEGTRQHAMRHFFDLVRAGRLDVTGVVTHLRRLDEWRDAFGLLTDHGRSGAVKVALDYR